MDLNAIFGATLSRIYLGNHIQNFIKCLDYICPVMGIFISAIVLRNQVIRADGFAKYSKKSSNRRFGEY